MSKFAIAGAAALAIAGSTAVYAQHRPWFHQHMRHMQINPEDRAAFTDARIAAVHAGLKLNPDQEKLWPPVEAAVRDFAKLRMDRENPRDSRRLFRFFHQSVEQGKRLGLLDIEGVLC